MSGFHTPVLLDETVALLGIKSGYTVIDATAGFAGHMREFVRRGAWVLGIDADQDALKFAGEVLKGEKATGYRLVRGNFRNIVAIARENGIEKADAVFFDLGVSSYQLDTGSRGFTYRQPDAPLDMRFDRTSGISAADLINTLSVGELYEIFLTYGEEKHSRAISAAIVRARSVKPIVTAGDLIAAIEAEVGSENANQSLPRVFQALRIRVNDEIGALREGLTGARKLLKPGARLGVISFHSLEDRIVKLEMRRNEYRIVTKKPVTASFAETKDNRRSRSAKLRVAEKIL